MNHFEEIRTYILNQAIINTHSHHLNDADTANLNLARIFENSYVSGPWCGEPTPSSAAEADRWIEKIGNRSYYRSLSGALQKLYSMDKPLSGGVWEEYDKRIRKAHENAQWHLDILRNICGYRTVILNSYWNPGGNNGLIKPEGICFHKEINYMGGNRMNYAGICIHFHKIVFHSEEITDNMEE